jgi:hypothetical protein
MFSKIRIMPTKKKTIKQAMKSKAIRSALQGLVGCPAGGWAETNQAWRQVREELPFFDERNYTVDDLIEAVLEIDGKTDRYRWRE